MLDGDEFVFDGEDVEPVATVPGSVVDDEPVAGSELAGSVIVVVPTGFWLGVSTGLKTGVTGVVVFTSEICCPKAAGESPGSALDSQG